jgi:uncharacterized protein (TIGR02001 family)
MERQVAGRVTGWAPVPFLAFLIAPAPLPAEDFAVTGDVTATTDYMFRGTSQTMSGAALQGSLGIAHDSGLSAWIWGSNVDFVADGDPDDGARVEMDLAFAYEHALSERLAATVGRNEYLFPGVDAGIGYDYGEWWAGLSLDGRHHVSAFHSRSVFGSGEPGWYVVAGTAIELPANVSLEVALGHAGLNHALGDSYRHVELKLSGDIHAFAWSLAVHATDESAKALFGKSLVEPRVVLSVTYAVWE